ncbi:MAG: hypothetical protein OEZ01_02230 [Candidatus Heimdallarchaeota archaeon]|nr:hypothetical protein [Candidatus Heimdallarchaeota archaeon]MDH5644793.1 hypothetical protein [Candidatus Heimdallarchaeota archaeon]
MKYSGEYKDILTFEPVLFKVIEEEEVQKLIRDPLYAPLIMILRDGPMTVREIEARYNEEADKERSDKSIYRYLKTLEKAEIVIPAGQRVILGKTASETLFSRTALAFYLTNEHKDFWLTNQGGRMTESIASLLTHLIPGNVDIKKLNHIFYEISSQRIENLRKMVKQSTAKTYHNISDLDWKKIQFLFNFSGMVGVFIENPSLLDKIKDCFNAPV